MRSLTLTLSDSTWEWLERYLSADELWNPGQYFTAVVEKDLNERRLKALEAEVRRELTKAGAVRVSSLELEEFARNAKDIVAEIVRIGEPVTLLVDGQPQVLMQDVTKVVSSATEFFRRMRGY
jgi:hypothetical protein